LSAAPGAIPMLRSRVEFDAFASDSRSRSSQLLVVRYRRNDLDLTRYGISTSRRLGGAVVRNRVRRRLRAALRALDAGIAPGWDVLIVARPPATSAGQTELTRTLAALLGAAGLVRADAQPS
jgi:ribonuclease P protein component